jgi:hypothetical protein
MVSFRGFGIASGAGIGRQETFDASSESRAEGRAEGERSGTHDHP